MLKKMLCLSFTILCVAGAALAQGSDTPNPVLIWKSASPTTGSDGQSYIGITLGISNYAKYGSEMFAVAPQLPPCGSNKNASRSWLNVYDAGTGKQIYAYCAVNGSSMLRTFSFNLKRENVPQGIYVVLDDRASNKTYKSNCVGTLDGKPCQSAGGGTAVGKMDGGAIGPGNLDVNPSQFKVAKPDLRVVDFYLESNNNIVHARIKNACKAPVTASFPIVLIIYEGKTNDTKAIFSQTKRLQSLAGEFHADVAFDITAVAKGKDIRGKHLIVVEVDSGNYIEEGNEKNNKFGISSPNQANWPEPPCGQ
jgi:hypothetical protein